MKIPAHILEAPLAYVDDNLNQVFALNGFGPVPLWTNHGCALFIYMDARSIKSCRYAVHSVKLELHEVYECPLIRFDIKIYDRPNDPLHMDCFLNINREDKGHLPAIEALMDQEYMLFHWYNEHMEYVRTSGIHWPVEQRECAKQIIKQAKAIIAKTGGGNFDQAKAKFMSDNPL